MLLNFFIMVLLLKDSMSRITIYGNKTVVYGRHAHYRCAVDNLAGVQQITWQWRPKASQTFVDMATYSTRFREQVNDPYVGKVFFTEASLNSSSITVRNSTWADEGCYMCFFSVFPDGSQGKQICPTVQGISEVKTAVISPDMEEEEQEDDKEVEVGVSCSASGKPAPTIQWAFAHDAIVLNKSQSAQVLNPDRTITSNGSITLKVPADWHGYVDCVLNEGKTGQRTQRIPFSFRAVEGNDEPVKRLSKSGIALVISVIGFIIFILVAVALRRKRLMSNKRNTNVF